MVTVLGITLYAYIIRDVPIGGLDDNDDIDDVTRMEEDDLDGKLPEYLLTNRSMRHFLVKPSKKTKTRDNLCFFR